VSDLRGGAEEAIEALGTAFLRHPANERLRSGLLRGALDEDEYYRELSLLIVRIAASLAAEERGMRLGPLALGSSLLSPQAAPWLWDAACEDAPLRAAVAAIEARPRAREAGAEELGSLHERLLELHARIHWPEGRLSLETAAGHKRKTTGSYYTPPSLVDCLLDSALDPVLNEAASAADPEAAILDLKVCDPACGSGRFLTAAARRIAARLARVRCGGGDPDAEAARRARGDVVSRCLYGVDVSPTAVELCKISLWMEAGDPGSSLALFEGRIQRGNALLGATPAALLGGIPDEAFNPMDGDDKEVARRLKKRNREERSIRARASARPGAARFAERLDLAHEKLLADAWCAAIMWPKLPGAYEARAITEGLFRRLEEDPEAAPEATREAVADLARRYAFFHWHLAFPEVFRGGGGGFDVILGNPPWERITVSDEEWFARRRGDIASVKGKAGRDRAIGALATGDPGLHATYREVKREEEVLARFLSREVGIYPLTGWKELNTYHLFAELSARLAARRGRVGLIVKTGIASADNCLPLWKKLLAERRLVSLFDFVNKRLLFPGVQTVERFSLITFTGAGGAGSAGGAGGAGGEAGEAPPPIRLATLCQGVEDIERRGRVYSLSPEDIALLSPKNGACPMLQGERDAEIMRRLYKTLPILGEVDRARGGERWNAEHTAIFHMSEDSNEFRRREDLLGAGAEEIGRARFRLNGEEHWPLYEGKYIHLLDHRHGSFEGVPAARLYGRKAEAKAPPKERLRDPGYEITPRYWFPKKKWLERAAKKGLRLDFQFLYRDITGVYPDLRTAIGAVTAAGPAGNSCPCLTLRGGGRESGRESARRLLAFAALFCSIPFDYVVRNRLFSKHINPNVLGQLVMPPPRAAVPEEGERGTLRARLVEAALALTYTSESLRPLGELMGARNPYVFDPEERFSKMREIDAIAARLFGLSRDELEHVLGSFETLAAAEVKASGEERTKKAVLTAFDAFDAFGSLSREPL
jgi:hypothetical protein